MLQASVADAEARMERRAAKDKSLVGLANKVDALTTQFAALFAQADDIHVTESRGEIAALTANVDELLSRIAETDERMAAIDARRRVVDEVQTKANAIVHLLDDVRVNLETLSEQKAVVDHVSEKVTKLEFTLQEARNTLRTLQHERELAERIEKGIKQLRSRTERAEERKRSA